MAETAQSTKSGFDYDEYLRRYSRSQKAAKPDSIVGDQEIRAMADKTIDIFARAMAQQCTPRPDCE